MNKLKHPTLFLLSSSSTTTPRELWVVEGEKERGSRRRRGSNSPILRLLNYAMGEREEGSRG